MAKPIRVFLADDHVAMRTGLRMLLEGDPDITVVGEARDRKSTRLNSSHT